MGSSKDLHELKVRVFLEKRNAGRAWVPYKILIGYGRGNQVVVDDRGEHLYDSREFATRESALSSAEDRVRGILADKFPESAALPLRFDVVEEG